MNLQITIIIKKKKKCIVLDKRIQLKWYKTGKEKKYSGIKLKLTKI